MAGEGKINWLKEIKSMTDIVLIVIVIRSFLIEPFYIPSSSMVDTLLIGDYVFSTKYNYGFSKNSFPFAPNIFSGRIFEKQPDRGDIIVFKCVLGRQDTRCIKRVIGLPGDKIELKNNIVYINDKELPREIVGQYSDNGLVFNKYRETMPNGRAYNILQIDPVKNPTMNLPRSNGVYNVPKDKYFFMGDNRDNSNDSRASLSFVSSEDLIGKAQIIHFSTAEELWLPHGGIFEQLGQCWSWIKSIRWHRMFKSVYN